VEKDWKSQNLNRKGLPRQSGFNPPHTKRAGTEEAECQDAGGGNKKNRLAESWEKRGKKERWHSRKGGKVLYYGKDIKKKREGMNRCVYCGTNWPKKPGSGAKKGATPIKSVIGGGVF